MKRGVKTAPFLTANGEAAPGSVAEGRYLRLGGVDQWVLIRGANVDNPLLIVLHGGPGFSDTAFFRYHTPELEQTFTMLYWDQRGAGRSYAPTLARSSMTVAQFIADLDELVELARARFGKHVVTLLGHSWGSALGVLYAARFPEKVALYVGVAQVGDWAASEVASYEQALANAERAGKRSVLKKLRELGPPPHSVDGVFTERTCAQRVSGGLSPKVLWNTFRMVVATREASLFDLPETLRAFRFSMECMWPEVSRLNLLEAAPSLAVPVVFMLGRRDPWIPPAISVAYFEALRAPSKTLVWFEESGHEPFVDEPRKFVDVMREVPRAVHQGG